MGNTKLQGSNIGSTEWFTGRCPAHCELCFVNVGIVGNGCTYGIYLPEKAGYGQFDYATGTTTEKRIRKASKALPLELVDSVVSDGPRRTRYDPRNWTPLPGGEYGRGEAPLWIRGMRKRVKRKGKPDEVVTHEPTRHLTVYPTDHVALYNLPKVPENAWYHRQRTAKVVGDRGKLPVILRVNTMSDSCTAPGAWIKQVREVWGEDGCFFNSSANAIKRWPANLDLFHKLVVTTNPGRQTPPKITYDAAGLAALPPQARRGYGFHSLRGRKDELGHFFRPQTMKQLGYPSLESIIKFYRVRALPTIAPRWNDEKYATVYTVLRFKSVIYACEFARKYELGLEFHCKSKGNANAKIASSYGFKVIDKAPKTEIHLWSKDKLNASPHRGEKTVMFTDGSFWRASKKDMGHLRWVCDRGSNSCKACGLCALLDGTASDNMTDLMRGQGMPLLEFDEQDHYLVGSKAEEAKANPGANEDLLQGLAQGLEARIVGRGRGRGRARANPGDDEVADRVVEAMQEVLSYVAAGGEEEDYRPMDQWNTHEDVERIVGLSVYWLTEWGKANGLDEEQTEIAAADFCERALGANIFGLFPGLLSGIYNGSADLCLALER